MLKTRVQATPLDSACDVVVVMHNDVPEVLASPSLERYSTVKAFKRIPLRMTRSEHAHWLTCEHGHELIICASQQVDGNLACQLTRQRLQES